MPDRSNCFPRTCASVVFGMAANIRTICKANAFVRSRKSFSSFYILTSSFRSLRRFFGALCMNARRKSAPSPIVYQPAAQFYDSFIEGIKTRIRTAQIKAALAANAELVLHYWEIGRGPRNCAPAWCTIPWRTEPRMRGTTSKLARLTLSANVSRRSWMNSI